MNAVTEVSEYEVRLLAAMLASDADVLADLIDDAVVFTGPDGAVLSKEQDLSAHRSGLLRLARLDPSETAFHPIGDLIVSTSKASLEGSFGGEAFAGLFAYTRVWAQRDGIWRVIAGQASAIG